MGQYTHGLAEVIRLVIRPTSPEFSHVVSTTDRQ